MLGLKEHDKLRAFIFLHIPATTTVEDVRAWIQSQVPHLHPVVMENILRFHAEDVVLAEWRGLVDILIDFVYTDN